MLLNINQLTKQYKRGSDGFYAVDHVNLEMKKGEFISIVGHSGSGKSTLLNMITGLIKPDEGSVEFLFPHPDIRQYSIFKQMKYARKVSEPIDGKETLETSKQSLNLYRNRKIGYVLQGQNLLSNFTILDNLCIPHFLTNGKEDIREKAADILKLVGLPDIKDAYPSWLSGGELRRIAIARALILDPVLLIADEPTSNLDPENAEKILRLFQSINKAGTAVLVSTHDMEFLGISNKVYKMEKGCLSSY